MTSSELIQDIRVVQNFTRLNFKAIGKVELIQADTESLVIEADRDVCNLIKTEVIDRVLVISYQGEWLDWVGLPFNNTDGITFHLKMKNIDASEPLRCWQVNLPKPHE